MMIGLGFRACVFGSLLCDAGRVQARRERKIYLGDYSSRTACCPLEGCWAADANQFPSDSFRAASG
jgi:hypothetical protein